MTKDVIAACGYGLGTCWVGAFDEKQVTEVMELPLGVRPVVIFPVGYPVGENKAPARRPVEELCKL